MSELKKVVYLRSPFVVINSVEFTQAYPLRGYEDHYSSSMDLDSDKWKATIVDKDKEGRLIYEITTKEN